MNGPLSLVEIYEEFLFRGSLIWPFLLGFVIVGACVYWADYSAKHKDAKSFWLWLFPKRIYSHRSSQLDVQFVFVNTALYGLFFSTWLLSAEAVAENTSFTLQLWLGAQDSIPEGYLWPSVALTVGLFIAMDFAFFICHWLQHRIPFLWRFHRVHHSAEVLNPLTAFRQHPVDQLFEGCVVGLVTGLLGGIFHYLFLGLADVFSLMGFNLLTFCFYISGAHLRHSHIRLDYPRWLSRLLISPFQHQVHHSRLAKHTNKNFGGVFACWDLWFGSLYLPAKNEMLAFGVEGLAPESIQSVLGLYLSPLVGIKKKKPNTMASGS